MKHIRLITTGGTIASRRDPATGHVTASLGAEELRATLPGRLEGIDLGLEEFCRKGSYAIDLETAFGLAQRIRAVLRDPATAGVVVTHGTDTLEESCFLADLLIEGEKPVVFTGAQRAADEPDTDGPRNILDSIRLAAAPQARGLGAMICFEQEFHAARDVTKTHTSRTETFQSLEHGMLGLVDDESILVHRRPALRACYAPARIEPRVELLRMAMGSDARLLRFAVETGAQALVIEAFGRGNTPPAVTAAVGEIVAGGVPVIITSRCPRGRVKPIYGNGGGKTLEEAGALFAGDLSGTKARILAAVLLGCGLSGAEFAAEFAKIAG